MAKESKPRPEKSREREPLSPEQRKQKRKHFLEDLGQFLLCILGGLIYAASINLIVLPSGLFIGNMTGLAQVVQDILKAFFPINRDITGLLLFLFNLPWFIISFTSINRKFFWKTVITVASMFIAMTFIPIVQILPETLETITITIIGAVIAGFGAGLCLQAGGSGGGTDIFGVYISMKRKEFSVGRINLIISLIIYAYAFFVKDFSVMIYSLIFTLIYAFVVDLTHYQNVKISLTIFTKQEDVLDIITKDLGRGATYWQGKGGYSGQDTFVINTVVSKYELIRLRRHIQERDPNAFIVESTDVHVTGKFLSNFF